MSETNEPAKDVPKPDPTPAPPSVPTQSTTPAWLSVIPAPLLAYFWKLITWVSFAVVTALAVKFLGVSTGVPVPPEVLTVPVEVPNLVEHPPDVLYYCGRVESVSDNLVTKPWPVKVIPWTVDVSGYSGSLTKPQIIEAFDIAWRAWTKDVDITPKYVEDSTALVKSHFADIDGSSKVLAWSELSDGTKTVKTQRYDRAERWTIAVNPAQAQIDLVRVACHEIGHVLGLVHDDVGTGALMEPTYSATVRFPTPRDSQRLIALGYEKRPVTNPAQPISISVAVDPEKLAEMLRRAGYEVKLIGR
jgi:hypothetical protein